MKMTHHDMTAMTLRHNDDAIVVANATRRIAEDTTMSERAENHIVAFVHALTRSDVQLTDMEFVTHNVYALEKGKKAIQAMTMKAEAFVDTYTRYIIKAMLARKTKTLTYAEQNAILAKEIECESLRATDKRLLRAESTARTQSSSTRVMLQALGIAAKDGKNLTLTNSDNAVRFLELFKPKK